MGRFWLDNTSDFEKVKNSLKEKGYDILDDNIDARRISIPRGRQTERLQEELRKAGIGYKVKTRR